MSSLNKLDRVLKETISAIEKGKQQIFDIAETARKEYERVQAELQLLQQQTAEIIHQVDELEVQTRVARRHLAEVDSNFGRYSEDDIKRAYEVANDLQVQLTVMQEREFQARLKRDELERSLKALFATVEKAEQLVSNVSVVLDFISGNLHDVNEQLEDMQQRQNMGLRIIRAQEEERKRIAREIHDGPAQAMANVVLRAEFCEKLLELEPDKVKVELQSLKEMVRLALKDVRKIIFDLRPMALDDLGLVPALRRYAIDYKEKYGLEAEFVFFGKERRLPPAVEVGVFRIIQEALNNIWKHAQADKIKVTLELASEKLNAVVKDNGKGFDMKMVGKADCRESLGLTSMRERSDLLEGELKIISKLGKGTEVRLRVPIKE